MALSTWIHKSKTWLITDNRWKVVEVYTEWPNAQANALEAAAWARVPKGTGWEAPVAQTVEITTDSATGKGTLIATYRSPTWWEHAEKNPSKGVLETRTSSRRILARFDQNGNLIFGTDTSDGTGRTVWKTDNGGEIYVYRPDAIQVVKAIVGSRIIYVSQFENKVGFLNSTNMPNFGSKFQSAGELLLLGITSAPLPYTKNRFSVVYTFGAKDGGWNNEFSRRKYEWRLQKVKEYDGDGVLLAATRSIPLLAPTDITAAVTPHKTANFSPISNLLSWS